MCRMGRNYGFWWLTISSGLGIYFGISVFFLFTFYYKNNAAGVLGLISGVFASIALHLVLLNRNNRLTTWYTPKNLKSLSALGFIFSLISLGLTIFLATYAAVNAIPLLPPSNSYYIAAVWAGLTFKWTVTVSVLSFRYARIIETNTPFLIVHEEQE